jgi:hypothetical protein
MRYGGAVTGLPSIGIAALPARALPVSVAPVSRVTAGSAIMVPWKIDFVPRVAELPVCQKTLLACVPPDRITCVLRMVVSVDPIWKMKTAFASPCPSGVTLPADRTTVLAVVYSPG